MSPSPTLFLMAPDSVVGKDAQKWALTLPPWMASWNVRPQSGTLGLLCGCQCPQDRALLFPWRNSRGTMSLFSSPAQTHWPLNSWIYSLSYTCSCRPTWACGRQGTAARYCSLPAHCPTASPHKLLRPFSSRCSCWGHLLEAGWLLGCHGKNTERLLKIWAGILASLQWDGWFWQAFKYCGPWFPHLFGTKLGGVY